MNHASTSSVPCPSANYPVDERRNDVIHLICVSKLFKYSAVLDVGKALTPRGQRMKSGIYRIVFIFDLILFHQAIGKS